MSKPRGICDDCGESPQASKGNGRFHRRCRRCHQAKYPSLKFGSRIKYRQYKKTVCEYCGFVPVHLCQLDVDHIDGNHQNNSIDNLQTLCANCHRLKTAIDIGFSCPLTYEDLI